MTTNTTQRQCEFSTPALHDVEDIVRYLSTHNQDAAHAFVKTLERCCVALSCHPEMGRSRDDVRAGLRSFVLVPNYCMYYDVIATGILVSRVLYTSRLLEGQNL